MFSVHAFLQHSDPFCALLFNAVFNEIILFVQFHTFSVN